MSHRRAGAGESVAVSAPVVAGSGLPGPLLLRSAHSPHLGANRSLLDFLLITV